MDISSPVFLCADEAVNRCHALAVQTLLANTRPFQDGLLKMPEPCILAGESYLTPWTRDCAYNTWNAGAHLVPEAAKNTLLSTLMHEEGTDKVRIGGQYWDAVAWVTGAWHYYECTGDRDFLPLMLEATANSLDYFERTEFDEATGLFEGAASYGDGVAAYPEPYSDAGGSSGIIDYPAAHPEIGKVKMKCLSTNALYYAAYVRAVRMEEALNQSERAPEWTEKAEALKAAINKHLWMEDEGRYGYFLGHDNELIPHTEGLGVSLALLLDVADEDKARKTLQNVHTDKYGIPCVWPLFERFQSEDGMAVGRHCGTVWPFIQGYWADAAARYGRLDLFDHEFKALTETADRHSNFYEIVHPATGEPEGGLQIDNGQMRQWVSCPHQTWSATAYIRMIHNSLCGLTFTGGGVLFAPRVPEGYGRLELKALSWGGATLDVAIEGTGTEMQSFKVNGREEYAKQPMNVEGGREYKVEIVMAGQEGSHGL